MPVNESDNDYKQFLDKHSDKMMDKLYLLQNGVCIGEYSVGAIAPARARLELMRAPYARCNSKLCLGVLWCSSWLDVSDMIHIDYKGHTGLMVYLGGENGS